MTLPGGTQADERPDQLLPGIPNEVTLNHITTKLAWSAFQILISVSSSWRHAIRGRKVYDARVRSHSTEALVLISCRCPFDLSHSIALYSKRANWSYDLPTFPEDDGIPLSCQCVALDGKLYVLGGAPESSSDVKFTGDKVYVVDLAGQREWKQCSHMLSPRAMFGCAALNGKIYVFGGCDHSEVYDPQEDTWSPIMPMASLRFDHYVVTMGEEIVVHGGNISNPDYFHATEQQRRDDGLRPYHLANFLEIYNPFEDNWRVVEPFERETELLFLADGKFHSISAIGIHVHDFDKKLWTPLYSFSLTAMGPVDSVAFRLSNIHVVDNELLALVDWVSTNGPTCGSCLVLSKGFGSKEIVWEKVEYPHVFGYWPFSYARYFMCPVEL